MSTTVLRILVTFFVAFIPQTAFGSAVGKSFCLGGMARLGRDLLTDIRDEFREKNPRGKNARAIQVKKAHEEERNFWRQTSIEYAQEQYSLLVEFMQSAAQNDSEELKEMGTDPNEILRSPRFPDLIDRALEVLGRNGFLKSRNLKKVERRARLHILLLKTLWFQTEWEALQILQHQNDGTIALADLMILDERNNLNGEGELKRREILMEKNKAHQAEAETQESFLIHIQMYTRYLDLLEKYSRESATYRKIEEEFRDDIQHPLFENSETLKKSLSKVLSNQKRPNSWHDVFVSRKSNAVALRGPAERELRNSTKRDADQRARGWSNLRIEHFNSSLLIRLLFFTRAIASLDRKIGLLENWPYLAPNKDGAYLNSDSRLRTELFNWAENLKALRAEPK